MFLLFGLTTRYTTLEQGQFDCPNEGGVRPYRRERSRRWFTLFFIPLVPLGRGDQWVRCGSCDVTYNPGVLLGQPIS